MGPLAPNQRQALRYLRRVKATPSSGYWCPLWAMEPPHVGHVGTFDGRTLAVLARRGLADRHAPEPPQTRPGFQLTPEGLAAAEEMLARATKLAGGRAAPGTLDLTLAVHFKHEHEDDAGGAWGPVRLELVGQELVPLNNGRDEWLPRGLAAELAAELGVELEEL